jgi:hypothetical protein
MENPFSAQVGPAGPTSRARPQPLTGGPRLSAPARAHVSLSLSLPLAANGADLSAPFLLAHTNVLSRCPADPTRQTLSLTSACALSPWMRPCPRVFRPPPHAPTPLEPAPHSPTSPCSFAPSAKHPRPLCRPACASRQLRRHSPKPTARSTAAVEPAPRPLPR